MTAVRLPEAHCSDSEREEVGQGEGIPLARMCAVTQSTAKTGPATHATRTATAHTQTLSLRAGSPDRSNRHDTLTTLCQLIPPQSQLHFC